MPGRGGRRMADLGSRRWGHKLLKQDMGVRAAETKRTDASNTGCLVCVPRHVLGNDPDRQGLPGDVRVGLFEMEAARQLLILQAKYGLDHTGDSGGRFKMADVALY